MRHFQLTWLSLFDRMRPSRLGLVAYALFAGLFAPIASAQLYSLAPYPVLGAGGAVSNSIFRVQGSLGQAAVTLDPATGGNFAAAGGSWGPELMDGLELTMTSTYLQADQNATVSINVGSTEGLTRLTLTLQWPADSFTFPALSIVNPSLLSGVLQTNGTALTVTLEMLPGQAAQGSQSLAQLTFSEAPSQVHSAFVTIPVSDVSAQKPSGLSYANYFVQPATVATISDAPLLAAAMGADQNRVLNLYGWPGTNYQLQYSTNLAIPQGWTAVTNYVQTNGLFSIPAPITGPAVFYRILQR